MFYFPFLFGSTIVLSVLLRTINKCVLGLPSALWVTPVDGSSYGPQDLTRSTSVSWCAFRRSWPLPSQQSHTTQVWCLWWQSEVKMFEVQCRPAHGLLCSLSYNIVPKFDLRVINFDFDYCSNGYFLPVSLSWLCLLTQTESFNCCYVVSLCILCHLLFCFYGVQTCLVYSCEHPVIRAYNPKYGIELCLAVKI